MTSPLFPPATPDGWDELIDNPYNIGPFERSTKSGDWWVVTGMHVRLPEALADQPAGTSKLLVFADTITIDGERRLDGFSDVLWICHTLHAPKNARLMFRRNALTEGETFRMAAVSRVAPSWTGPMVMLDGGSLNGQFLQGDGWWWGWSGLGEPRQREFHIGPMPDAPHMHRTNQRWVALPQDGPGFDECRPFLSRLILTAQSLFDAGRPDDAERVLQRLERLLDLNANVPSWRPIAAQCTATREMFQHPLAISDRVPALSPAIYGRVAQSYALALRDFAESFNQFIDRKIDLRHRRTAAELMLNQEDGALRFQALVTEQLEGNLAEARTNLQRAQESMRAQTERVRRAEVVFQDGVDAWRDETRRAANRAIVFAVIGAVAGVGAALAGNPNGVAGAAAQAAQAADNLARLVQTLQKLVKVLKAIAELLKMIDTIMPQVTRRLDAATLAGRIASTRLAADPSNLNGAPSESVYWEQFCEDVEMALAPTVEHNIQGAREYLREMRIMIIYGRALTAAQAAIPPIAQELAQANLLTKLAEEQGDAVSEQIRTLRADTPPATLASALWLRHRGVRRAMFAALLDYDAAHRYWALPTEKERQERNPNRPIANLADDLLNIADMDVSVRRALDSFNPSPQDFTRVAFKVPDDALEEFLNQGSFTLRFKPDFGPVAGWGDVGRVRVQEVAVWVIWKDASALPRTMEFTVRSDGDYYDQRVDSGDLLPFRFLGPRVNRTFRYNPARAEQNRENAISVRARVAEDFRAQFSEPTLFTGWHFSLPRNRRGEINGQEFEALRDNIKEIELEFSGSFIRDKKRF